MIDVARIVLVEDNDIIQLGLKSFIADLPDFKVVAAFSSFDGVGNFLDKEGGDILILDDLVPGQDTASYIRYLRFNFPSLKVIVFGADLYGPIIRSYLDCGAMAFIYKEELLRHCLAEGLHAVRQGRLYISHQASTLLLSGNNLRPLSRRLYQVLKALGEWEITNPQDIAKRLNLSVKAVYNAKERLREFFNVRTNEAVVAEAIRQGYIKRPGHKSDSVNHGSI